MGGTPGLDLTSLLDSADPDRLPYRVVETRSGVAVAVHFEPLTARDGAELAAAPWSGAVFAPVWQQVAGEANTRKLVCSGGADGRIQGLLRIGKLSRSGGPLKASLLETAPFNRSDGKAQGYRGVGRVLVARLAVEDFLLGGEGRVRVTPRPGTEAFYIDLGFVERPRLLLLPEGAEALIRRVLDLPANEEP